jgi:predicted RNA-binding Zn ribbon-like protein
VLEASGDGQRGFRFLGGRACLDLTATAGERWGPQTERLRTPADLARWLVEAGLAGALPEASRQNLAQARTLREAVYQTVKRRIAGQPPGPGDLAIVNDWAGQAPPRVWLEADAGRLRARRDAATAAALLASVARDAVDLLGGPLADRIRECSGQECALLFLDTSRAGRRRWCSMAACGARAKMAAYRARHTGDAQPAAAGLPRHPRRQDTVNGRRAAAGPF